MSEGDLKVTNTKSSDGLFYYYNSSTETKAISRGFETAYSFTHKVALVKEDGRWGLIDRSGQFIYKAKTKAAHVSFTTYEDFVLFEEGEAQKVFNLEGEKEDGYIDCALPLAPNYYIEETKSGKYKLRSDNDKVFKRKADTIIAQEPLMYEEDDLIWVNKNDKYKLYTAAGTQVLKQGYSAADFLDKYIMYYENGQWHYTLYKNDALVQVLSSSKECLSDYVPYQKNVIGIYKENGRYNFLKTNGKTGTKNFEFIETEGTYGKDKDGIYILDVQGDPYAYYKYES